VARAGSKFRLHPMAGFWSLDLGRASGRDSQHECCLQPEATTVPGLYTSVTRSTTTSNIVCALILSFIVAPAAPCQQEARGGKADECTNKELFNGKGWTVPGLVDARVKIVGAKVKQDGIPDDITIDVLEPSKADGEVMLVRCMPGSPGRLEVRSQPVTVREIWRLKRKDRTFGFKINAALTGGNGVALGASEVLLFYDPDGFGQFKVQRDVAGPQPLFIPEWVKAMRNP